MTPLRWLAGRARKARPGSRSLRAVAKACVVAAVTMVGSACYMYQPIVAPAMPGTRVSVELNDVGRKVLADSLGGFVDRVEGTVQTATDTLLVLRVASVEFLNGQTSRWTNEAVSIPREAIRDVLERRFSRGRTTLVSAGVLGAIAAFVTSRSLLGGGHEPRPGQPPPPNGQ